MATTGGSTSGFPLRTALAALVAGVVALGLLVAFAVGLPKTSSEPAADDVSLPDTLPGGWTALESVDEQQGAAVDYVQQVLAGVYTEEPTDFRAYVDDSDEALLTATVFASAGGAFSPPNGVADPAAIGLERAPVELTREGDAVCVSSYQSAAQPGAEASTAPISVSCQESHEDVTVQVGSQGLDVDETVALLGELTDTFA